MTQRTWMRPLVEQFKRCNPRAEVVGYRGSNLLVKLKPIGANEARIFEVVGGSPERPVLREFL